MREAMIQKAIDANLSGLYMTDEQKQAVYRRLAGTEEKEAPHIRFSAVMVFALILLLMTAGAVAAVLLGGKDFTKQVVAPMAMETESESFTADEVGEIIRLAEENGLSVPQQLKEHWARWGSEYKEELMRALVKTELGFYPGSWSLEDQHWYNEMLVECGLSKGITNLLPGENDFTEEKVLYMANTLFREKLGLTGDINDPAQFQRYLTFGLDLLPEGRQLKQWSVGYEDLKTGTQYDFLMLDNGLITRASRYDAVSGDVYQSALTEEDIVASFRQHFGKNPLQWHMEVLEQFYHSFAMCDHALQASDPGIRYVGQTPYLMPGSHYTYMTEEEAVQLARKACKLDESLPAYVIYFGDDPGNMHWKISFYTGTEENRQFCHYAQINGKTGETEYAGNYQDAPWFAPLVNASHHATEREYKLFRTWETPEHWGSELFSEDYWQALNALHYNAETRETLLKEWHETYGEHSYQWPYAHQAAYWWWEMNPKFELHNYHVPGIPVDGEHLSSEEAQKIALDAFMAEAPALFSQEELSNMLVLTPDFHYQVTDGQIQHHVWYFDIQIPFPDGTYSDSLIYIDAHTGDILHSDISAAPGNG